MIEIDLKENPYLIFQDGKLKAFSEIQNLVAANKPVNNPKIEAVKRKLETDYKDYGNRNLEVNGPNDGPFVNSCLASVGLSPGQPWCMGYVYKTLHDCGIEVLKTGYVPSLETWSKDKKIYSITPELFDIVMLYDSQGPYHVGFVLSVNGEKITTQEGNTNTAGSSEGIGIFKRERNISDCAFVRWKNL